MPLLPQPQTDPQLGRAHGEYTVAAGQTSPGLLIKRHVGDHIGVGVGIMAKPGAGGTALVEYTLDSPAAVDAGTAAWLAWPKGAVSSVDADNLTGLATAIRFTATTQDADFRVLLA